MELNNEEKKYLLELARKSIEHYFKFGKVLNPEPGEVPSPKLAEDAATFVTLHENKMLRGCIGILEARRPLIFDVINNALAAAFEDPRFRPLKKEELSKVKISISVLTQPKELKVKDWKDLLEKLIPKKHGLIIKKGWKRATYLPVVWEELTKKEEFLSELSQKAGLMADEWKDKETEFFTYEAIEFEE